MNRKNIIVNSAAVILFGLIGQSCAPDKMNIWQQGEGVKWRDLSVSKSENSGFRQLSATETGITFVNTVTKAQIDSNQVLLNGSGIAVGDIDGDDLVDLYFCRLNGPNVLYKNLGNWKFADITDSAGVACSQQFSTGAALADIDGDSDLDLIVTAIGGPNACFLNDGTGRFTDVTHTAGITSSSGASSMALADIDADGDLDLYIANYKVVRARDIFRAGDLVYDRLVQSDGETYRIAPKFENHFVIDLREDWVLWRETAEPDRLFLNDGKGHFTPVLFTDGRFLDSDGECIPEPKDWGLSVRFQDMDDDGDPDIYVCNDFESPDRIWINDGNGFFRSAPDLSIRKTSYSSRAVDFSDIDRDGDTDFMVVDLLSPYHKRRMTQSPTAVVPQPIGAMGNRPAYMQNTLFLNRGDNTYLEIAYYSGVAGSEWSWTNLFLDVDLDGYEDVIVGTGHFYDARDADTMKKAAARERADAMIPDSPDHNAIHGDKLNTIWMYPKLELPNFAFRNCGDLTFDSVGKTWGVASKDITHGMALGDLDNDGDLDLVSNRLGAPAGVYRNETGAPRIAVRLRGMGSNTQGIGAKIRVTGGPVSQSKEVVSAGAYLSSSDPFYCFATGEAKRVSIEIRWRNGTISTINNAKANRMYEIYEIGAQPTEKMKRNNISKTQPTFEDVSHFIEHQHHEDRFDDFERQPLMCHRLSQSGPGITWYDWDRDEDQDLIITGGKGGNPAVLRNDGQAGFHRRWVAPMTTRTRYDQTAALVWPTGDSSTSLLLGHSNYENADSSDSFVMRYDFVRGQTVDSVKIEGDESSLGAMAMADYDSDGDLDLLIAGRSVPGRYPMPASVRLYLNEAGSFQLDSLNTDRLRALGLIAGAAFSDFDADGDPDIILAIEWGPVTVFRNDSTRFVNVTEELGLDKYLGWWQGVATGDLDGDGKPEIIASNWGLNNKYRGRYDEQRPLRVFHGDFDGNGSYDLMQAYTHLGSQKLLPERNLTATLRGIPSVRWRMPDNRKYSWSTVPQILGPAWKQVRELKANTLAHMVFFNRNSRFEAVEMPLQAQLSTAFHVGVVDYDGDGHEDVFMTQNFFATDYETPRTDAGRGLWLRGDGLGGLKSVPGQTSGVKVYGEQRGAAFCDYNEDGRVDLAVSQNGAATKLYRNVGAKPGLRISLAGPKGNFAGVGAAIRLIYDDGYGPVREVQLGSGYWSQNSVVQVMGVRGNARGVWVRWPGGRVTETQIPAGTTKVVVQANGDNSERIHTESQEELGPQALHIPKLHQN
ncbi:FG-GAP-like repeat-containing protein [bacterium]|nr:FG-GAP-like repeat-containing protein [bacterium]